MKSEDKIPVKAGLFFFFLIAFSYQISFAQSSDTTQAHTYWNSANDYYGQRQYDSASFYYNLSSTAFQEAGYPDKVGHALLRLGNCFYYQGDLPTALKTYLRCIEVYSKAFPEDHLKLASPISGIGGVYVRLGEPLKAKEYYNEVYSILVSHHGENHIKLAPILYNLGNVYMELGDYDKAREYYLKTLPIYLDKYGESDRRISNIYVNLGMLYDKMGDITHAIEYYLKANEIDIGQHGESYWLLAYNYNNLGISYDKLNSDSLALLHLKRSAEIARDNNLHEVLASSFTYLGNVYTRQRNYKEALNLYQQSIAVLGEHLSDQHPLLNDNYIAISAIERNRGNYTEAESHLQKALAIVKHAYGEIHPWIGSDYQKLAELHRIQKKYPQADEAIESGIQALSRPTLQRESDDLADQQVIDLRVFLSLVVEKAILLEAVYSEDSEDIQLLRTALEHYQKSIALIDQIRRNYTRESSKVLLQKEATKVYERAIRICHDLYNYSDSTEYLELALQFSEKSKATVLAETLQANTLTQIQGIPQTVLEEEKSLNQKIRLAKEKLTDNPADTLTSQEVFTLTRQYDSLASTIAHLYPHYYNLKYNLEVASANEVRESLSDNQAILSYFEGDSVWYVFFLTHHSITLNEVTKADLPVADLIQFRDAISNSNSDYRELATMSFQIYHQLVDQPLEGKNNIHELTIVPDGILGYIPFDALVSQSYEPTSTRPHYLIEDYTLSYANSLTLLAQSGDDQNLESELAYVGFAPEYPENLVANSQISAAFRDVLAQLPGTQQEVRNAGNIFSGLTFLKQQATESNFKNLESSPTILHLAMHALVDDQDPMQSKLLFTEASDSTEDSHLHAYEIYNLKLSSDLVVLSACNTGYGKINRGEGIMSLSRAFMYAGCPTIVMSLWRARDQPTTQIISSFFKNLKDNQPKDQALREAKLNYLRNADPLKAHPANWATFVLLGNAEPVIISSNYNYWWIGGGLLLVLASLAVLRFRNRKVVTVTS